MITIEVINGKVKNCLGLIPGQDVFLLLEGKQVVLHRHGSECHAHDLDEEQAAVEQGG